MKINNQEIVGEFFAYDGCHKIYILEDDEDIEDAKNTSYQIYPIKDIENAYNNSCELRLISNWKLNKFYVKQFEDEVVFE